MRVAFVTAVTDHHENAAPDRAARVGRIATRLAERGHAVRTFCSRWWDSNDRVHTVDGHDYQAVTDSPAGPFARRLPLALRRWGPEIIHTVHDDPAAVVTASLGGGAVVVDWYDVSTGTGDGFRSAIRSRLRRRAARSPERVVAPSQLVQTRLRQLGRDADDIDVIPTGIDFEAIREIEPDDTAEIVYSRPLDEAANLESLLLALAEFRRHDWTCAVVGDGPARSEYESQAADLRIDDRVQFLGERSVENRVALFRGAHVYVHTATRTAFPLDLLRALAAGCIGIVAYHENSSAHELIEGEDRGFRTTSPEEIADALVAAADLDHQTIDTTYETYAESSILRRYLRLYRELGAGN